MFVTTQILRRAHLSVGFLRHFKVSRTRNLPHVDEVLETAKAAGYRSEVHTTKTVDGYILKIHRLLPQKHSVLKGSAFLMHGLFRNASDFLATGPKIALAYYLADNGYDVWMGNARGTKYSAEHEKLDCSSKAFWNFSFHEIGLFDLSAMLDFVLDCTKEEKAFYVGHSQGTCSLLALLASVPTYNDKIKEAYLMTPSVFMQHSSSRLLTMPAKRHKIVTVNKANCFSHKSHLNLSFHVLETCEKSWKS